ncbi:dual specificity protein phosphatase MPK-4-like isoform X2 [Cydia pomonella]|uniref:dual specificity protein phosphatase MPK-4-like isoform X1 n=1 Tax=Cydia pomonella TaxID=82600 RepID=UPI002ADD7ECA|nr:dual specificity protein phosphatase MPK-4-like isoform X1 [Cydia pomonella]XP_061722488.1 dual specificity protein phosphatase MPK-4-like isoform X2 [Cydia pomonella]XP_061722493.1 dual specificity protein phosphatase MPK-4-like isoform X2 [Cydia pomonella]
MAQCSTDADVHVAEADADDQELDLEISVDKIDEGLFLGNLACAREQKTLETLGITHILTIDLVPLPRSLQDRIKVVFKYVKLADVPKDDLISHLPECNEFIENAVEAGGNVLVHCYFGVSRSAAVVVGYIMKRYFLDYEDAFRLVKSHRRFVGPNPGFVAQLKLYGQMGYVLNKDDPRYKQFRLKMAGQKLKQVKILPQLFADLIKPDPGLVRERPDPVVYRCKKCRRVVASQNNIIPHVPKQVKVELAKKGIRPSISKLPGLPCSENGQVLIQKLKSLACQILDNDTSETTGVPATLEGEGPSHLDGYHEQNLVDAAIAPRDCTDVCRLMLFVEPMAWMSGVTHDAQGKLHCPKCSNKIGSFSWVCGCKCPCGQKVAPAFYLVPSKVEWSNIVQNVQVTV